ncbi:DNA polymerase III subunit delta' [Propionibacterium australiense]|uniref:DNA polymerase III subunit delta n=1 Tax=Propionibacterium australiense TaxID=119981 RepID=A0A383S6B3_9ACTN|nr:DNA polymerase III subunit delta' [Propionibacterium australiense]RLP09776.1 DNA polymerase III subunit delta' [Propionibacterium australiense]RLP10175.1 DNA polymerase III subunit delta' [Propionibacterium australiense]SYZ33251.1 DNA polymerase III, delta subunit [Propionibacterium australiense]VEH89255.1 DNA polymerase III subunit tau [Propionibacterium australiense]
MTQSPSGQPAAPAAPEPQSGPLTGVWADLVGQSEAVTILRRAVAGGLHAMTHAWLVTGPPGSGRSNAARAFAAALQCPDGGCGSCRECRSALSGAHPDVTLVRTEKLSIGVDEVRDLVRKGAMSPTMGRYQVIVVEDADRITVQGADALLKSIEEPPARTVWILCAPTADDVIVTIRSRCRQVGMRTPADADVVRLLIGRDGVDPAMAEYAARAAQGHIGRAKALARSEEARAARRAVLKVPSRLTDLTAALSIAAELVDTAADEAKKVTDALDEREKKEFQDALGYGTKGARPRNAAAALKSLTDQQTARAKRLRRDALDRSLTELTTWYRDVLAVQTGAVDSGGAAAAGAGEQLPGLINIDMRDEVRAAAAASTPERTLACIDAILACREALMHNVAEVLAVEAMLVQLSAPGR